MLYEVITIMQRLLFFQLSRELGLEHLKPAGKPLQEFTQSFCFAVRKGNTSLVELLNEGLSIVLANGTFNRLYSRWILVITSYSIHYTKLYEAR